MPQDPRWALILLSYLPAALLGLVAGITVARIVKAPWLLTLPGIPLGFTAAWLVLFIMYARTAT